MAAQARMHWANGIMQCIERAMAQTADISIAGISIAGNIWDPCDIKESRPTCHKRLMEGHKDKQIPLSIQNTLFKEALSYLRYINPVADIPWDAARDACMQADSQIWLSRQGC
eukprot:333246-Pelagomonas_calceolata.AAC.7